MRRHGSEAYADSAEARYSLAGLQRREAELREEASHAVVRASACPCGCTRERPCGFVLVPGMMLGHCFGRPPWGGEKCLGCLAEPPAVRVSLADGLSRLADGEFGA